MKRKKHTLILGDSGIGKTSLLKHLNENYLEEHSVYSSIRPPKALLENIAQHLSITHKKSTRKNELLQRIKNYKPRNTILLLDNIELETRLTGRLIKELQRAGILVISAGQYERKKNITYDDKIRLRTLNKEEVNELVTAILTQEYENIEEIKQIILQNTSKKPEQVKKICEQTKILKEYNEEHNIRKQIRPTNKRINLISTNNLINLAYLFITLRYVFYRQRKYEIGYIMSTIAYLIFFLFRRRKK